MRAGALDRRVAVERFVAAGQDAHGQETGTWTALATIWATVKQTPGREFLGAAQTLAERRVVFTTRWLPFTLTVKDRIVFEGRPHDIADIRELGRRVGLEISATAKA